MPGSSEECPTTTPQPDPTDDKVTVQEAQCRAENAGRIADDACAENARLQEQIKELKSLFIQQEQKLIEEKGAAEKDALQAKATAKTARADAGEILGAFKQFVLDLEKREKAFLDGRLDIEKEIQRTVGSIQKSEMHIQELSGGAEAAAGRAETAAHAAQGAVGNAQTVAGEAQTAVSMTVGEAQTAVRTATDEAQTAIRTARDPALTAIDTAKNGALTAIDTAKNGAQTAIQKALDQAKRDQETAENNKLETRHKWILYAVTSDYSIGKADGTAAGSCSPEPQTLFYG